MNVVNDCLERQFGLKSAERRLKLQQIQISLTICEQMILNRSKFCSKLFKKRSKICKNQLKSILHPLWLFDLLWLYSCNHVRGYSFPRLIWRKNFNLT